MQAAARKVRDKLDAIRDHVGDPELALRKAAGMAHWNPEGLPEGMEPGLTAVAFVAAPNLDPPDVEDRVASSGAHGFIVDVCAVEIERETGAVTRHRLRHASTTPGRSSIRSSRTARCSAASRTGSVPRSSRRTPTTRTGTCCTASLVDYLTPTAPDVPALRIDHLSSPSPFTALGAKGLGEGNTMSAPAAIANAVADALGRDDVELPLTAPRVWELLQDGSA